MRPSAQLEKEKKEVDLKCTSFWQRALFAQWIAAGFTFGETIEYYKLFPLVPTPRLETIQLRGKTVGERRVSSHRREVCFDPTASYCSGSCTTTGIHAACFWNATTTTWSGTLSTIYDLSAHQAETPPWQNWIYTSSSFTSDHPASPVISTLHLASLIIFAF